ncbi:ATP-binding protein [Bacillus cereus]|uniref:ATP-binding protein n=1 Tax=Bacillus thuringiensis serovar yosoo TaxID=180848 RepID=A0A9X6ID07_BACTU|nr:MULTISPECIES: ATP-binding protein [Bacillus cereus group]MDA1926416.1 ATP-binding protein [Bacillus cereus]MDA2185987.1 ATP-binding protein [Bacillus cereus]OTY53234.1 ATP-binding protein [Bacillus thuringiensis serovar yosoo]QDD86933.1 hypothetical protein FORC087_143 [Bacillus cereus]
MNNAELLFQTLKDNGWEEIQRMIAEQQEETVFLDFKRKTDHTTNEPATPDRKNYAKALSGFANTSGGIIIWGVDARKNDDGIDAAIGQKLIANAKAFQGELNSLLANALSPLLPGIENIHILNPNNPKEGFVVTYVPASDLPPHQALLQVNKYCMRSGDNFVQMEHANLADAFGRRQRPVLQVQYEIQRGLTYGGVVGERQFEYSIVVGIRNIGRYVATYPAIRIKEGKNLRLLERASEQGLPLIYQSKVDIQENGYMFVGGVNDVVHPGSYKAVYPLTIKGNIKEAHINGTEPLPDDYTFSFSYEIFAQGCEPVKGEVTIPFEEIKKVL